MRIAEVLYQIKIGCLDHKTAVTVPEKQVEVGLIQNKNFKLHLEIFQKNLK